MVPDHPGPPSCTTLAKSPGVAPARWSRAGSRGGGSAGVWTPLSGAKFTGRSFWGLWIVQRPDGRLSGRRTRSGDARQASPRADIGHSDHVSDR